MEKNTPKTPTFPETVVWKLNPNDSFTAICKDGAQADRLEAQIKKAGRDYSRNDNRITLDPVEE